MRRISTIVLGLAAIAVPALLPSQDMRLPLAEGSVRFLVLGDAGTGDTGQRETAAQIAKWYRLFPFTFAIMLGDNIYGSERPQDFDRKFVQPYKPLLDAEVEFHAALGNHDDPNQRYYKLYNLDGKRFRTFKKGNVRFFVLDTNYLDPDQVRWLENELKASGSEWKIAYFHHPLYTTARRGPEVELRAILEPLFVRYNVDIVFAGHEHIYERFKPVKGIHHFTVGGSAKLRRGDTRPNAMMAAAYDRDRSFLLVEISDDRIYFQAVSRTGQVVDEGNLLKRQGDGRALQASPPAAKASP